MKCMRRQWILWGAAVLFWGCSKEGRESLSSDKLTGKAADGQSASADQKEKGGDSGDSAGRGAAGIPDQAPTPGPSSSIPPNNSSPGDPNEPPPSGQMPLGSAPLPAGTVAVTVEGTVIFADYKQGDIQIDVGDRPQAGGPTGEHPKILQLYRMEKPGPFKFEVPAGQGEVHLSAYNDENGDGKPSREEPRGQAKEGAVKVGKEPVKGITIELKRDRIPPPPGQKR